ncbi:MAG: DUF896 domain-containing protein [Fusobacteriaceae bacterium]
MKMEDIIAKVNFYSQEAKKRELNEEEKKEREKYRKLYLEQFKMQVRGHLDRVKIVDDLDENPNKIN